MNYIRITKDNIDKEHICCAMSNKQSVMKKEWLTQRFDEGLVFYRSEERGKCFIEYIPAENAWVPIIAEGYIYINCLWVSGSLKGHMLAKTFMATGDMLRSLVAQFHSAVFQICKDSRQCSIYREIGFCDLQRPKGSSD